MTQRHKEDMPHCPECGGVESIYARADIRWQDMTQSWEIGDMEDSLDCTECDRTWSLSESDFPQAETLGERESAPSSAPDLLAALEKIARDAMALANDPVMTDRAYFYNIGRDAEKAIAKARGEG